MKKGLTHIYTGDGKGKTTAAMGLCVRALGHGLKVEIFQFCKSAPSGELQALKGMQRCRIHRAENCSSKFVWDMSPEEKAEWSAAQQALFDEACEAACSGEYDIVLLDEIFGALSNGAFDLSEVKYLMTHKSNSTELLLTGRAAPAELIRSADYATEMVALKHPHDEGVFARRGIEY